jgi:hypothetical protein
MPIFNSFTGAAARALGIISSDPPGTPLVTSQTATATSITVAFSISDGAFPIVNVEYQFALSANAYPNDWVLVSGSTRTVTLSNLTTDSTYKFRVRAKDQAEQYSLTTEITQATSSELAPSAPSSITVTPSSTTALAVSFGASTAGTYPIDRYQYSLNNGAYQNTGVSPGQTFTISGLGINSANTVAIKAISASPGVTSSAATASASVSTNPLIPAVPTTNWNRMTASDRELAKLSWSNVSNSETGTVTYYVNSYEVNQSGAIIATLPQQVTTSTQSDIAVVAGKSYTFSVSARNRLNQDSGLSAERRLTTGQTNQPYFAFNYGVEVHIARQRSGFSAGAIVVNLPLSVPVSPLSAGYVRIDSISVEVRRAQYTGDSPFTTSDFGHTQGMHFQLMDGQNGGVNVVTQWALPSDISQGSGFNVHGQYSGTIDGVTTRSPFIINLTSGNDGGSLAGRSIKVTALSTSAPQQFTQVTTGGTIASPSNNLIARNLICSGVTTTASTFS